MTLQKENQAVIVSNLKKAESFSDRGIGLLGHKSLPEDEGLWILATNSIHTCFMKFSIACVFVDHDLKVKKIVREIKPWRLVLPVWGATSVFELPVSTLSKIPLEVGDRLYVVD